MVLKEIKNKRKCKVCRDCGGLGYAYKMGWEDNGGKINWHPPKYLNQCKDCRKKMYERIEKNKKENRDSIPSKLQIFEPNKKNQFLRLRSSSATLLSFKHKLKESSYKV